MKLDWLIFGLGNPGLRYQGSRHNAGFDVLDGLLLSFQNTGSQQTVPPDWEPNPKAPKNIRASRSAMHTALLRTGPSQPCVSLLVKPQTYMNLSGKVLSMLHQKYTFVPKNCIVVLDNLDLEPGRLRLKFGGSGSHNGLRSLCENGLKSGFWRLFVGIGHPDNVHLDHPDNGHSSHREPVESYVLRKPEQAGLHADAISRAQQALMQIIQGTPPEELIGQVNHKIRYGAK